MPEFDGIDPMFPPAIMFKVACPDVFAKLAHYFTVTSDDALIYQLDNVWIMAQRLGPSPDNFSIRAYPLPVPTYEQRLAMELKDERDIDVEVGSGRIRIVIGPFGLIERFYVTGLPNIFYEINDFMPCKTQ